MRKTIFSSLALILLLLPFSEDTHAIGGTCSSHEGVNCSAGADYDNSAICNDGWRDSSEIYWETVMCNDYLCPAQVLLRDTLYAKAEESGALEMGTSELCEKAGLTGYSSLSTCLELRSKEIQAVHDSIASQVKAVRYLCYSDISSSSCTDTTNGYQGSDGKCYCNIGYEWSDSANKCTEVKKSCDPNQSLSIYNECLCSSGYRWNEDRTKCISIKIEDRDADDLAENQSSFFGDIGEGDKNYKAVKYLKSHKVISGYDDGTFRPNNTVNRAELLKILIGARYDLSGYKNCFKDVKEEWFAPYICYAKGQGWVDGYTDGTFRPAQTINRAEAIKMAIEVFEVRLSENATENPYSDVPKSEWFAKYVHTGKNLGLFDLMDKYSATDGMKRGDISDIIYRLLLIKEFALIKYDKSIDSQVADE